MKIKLNKLSNIYSINSKLSLPTKLFGLLLISSILTILSGWIITHELDRESTEFFQYLLLLWCAILAIFWVIRSRNYRAISIPIIYFYLFMDDANSIHDIFSSSFFVPFYNSRYGSSIEKYMRIEHIGEIIYWFLILVILILISLPAIISGSKQVKKFIRNNFFIFGLLSFFAIFVDVIGGNWEKWISLNSESLIWLTNVCFVIFEEFGETTILAFSCIWLFSLCFINKPTRFSKSV